MSASDLSTCYIKVLYDARVGVGASPPVPINSVTSISIVWDPLDTHTASPSWSVLCDSWLLQNTWYTRAPHTRHTQRSMERVKITPRGRRSSKSSGWILTFPLSDRIRRPTYSMAGGFQSSASVCAVIYQHSKPKLWIALKCVQRSPFNAGDTFQTHLQ